MTYIFTGCFYDNKMTKDERDVKCTTYGINENTKYD